MAAITNNLLCHHFMELQKLNSLDLTPPKMTNGEIISFLASLNLPTKQVKKKVKKKVKGRKVPQAPIIDDDDLPSAADMAYLRGEY